MLALFSYYDNDLSISIDFKQTVWFTNLWFNIRVKLYASLGVYHWLIIIIKKLNKIMRTFFMYSTLAALSLVSLDASVSISTSKNKNEKRHVMTFKDKAKWVFFWNVFCFGSVLRLCLCLCSCLCRCLRCTLRWIFLFNLLSRSLCLCLRLVKTRLYVCIVCILPISNLIIQTRSLAYSFGTNDTNENVSVRYNIRLKWKKA